MYRVAVVCEGPTDRAIIEAILDTYLDDYEPIPVQPPLSAIGGDAGPLGGGWKGVQLWCKQEAPFASQGDGVNLNADLVIIQIDADVSRDEAIDRTRPCPPSSDGANEVRNLLLAWLRVQAIPAKVVLCVPSMATETWALVALYPDDAHTIQCVECHAEVKSMLRTLSGKLRPKLVVSKAGTLKNQARGYAAHSARISDGWPGVIEACEQAARFDTELRDKLPLRT